MQHFVKKIFFLVPTVAFMLLCFVCPAAAQDVTFIKAAQIGQWKTAPTDTVYVINFWATWCAPCVAELPAFEKLQEQYAGQKVKVILVSTDFKKDVETRVKPFIREKKLHNQVAFMDESNPNNWIELVSGDWSGLIPATLIIARQHNFEYFFEGPMEYEVLEKAVLEALAP